ncbi:hypothetical protein SAMN05880582_101717 [Rhizobium sp. RU20A]|uniref:hypothetical protein n=1 Tax=Rhizobium sp. RU20A TaxID=1907412 RepID=UPI000956828D|nr:hypothetical protein [Rhizobium sp. RU20A]SIQ09755.1 hypothetical protein SAMN05880582_101717 [Rhizobium sp. RU20A]
MTSETISLDFLARQAKAQLDDMRLLRQEMAGLRQEMAGMMRLMTANYDLVRRVERRESELRDDIELMVKMELGGSLANIQTAIETSLARIEKQVGDVGDRVSALEDRP